MHNRVTVFISCGQQIMEQRVDVWGQVRSGAISGITFAQTGAWQQATTVALNRLLGDGDSTGPWGLFFAAVATSVISVPFLIALTRDPRPARQTS